MTILYPLFGMIALSCLVLILLYASRFYLIAKVVKSGGELHRAKHSDESRPSLPGFFRNVTDNYNHIFEQPTLFYAAVVYIYLMNHADPTHVALAWGYVAARAIHSMVQITINHVPTRIVFFIVSGFCLASMIIREALAFV